MPSRLSFVAALCCAAFLAVATTPSSSSSSSTEVINDELVNAPPPPKNVHHSPIAHSIDTKTDAENVRKSLRAAAESFRKLYGLKGSDSDDMQAFFRSQKRKGEDEKNVRRGSGLKASLSSGEDATVYQPLPALNIDPNSITISGFDTGAIFANQLQISHSKVIKGAGLVSGVPFMCSQGTLIGAAACMENPLAIMNGMLAAQALTFQGMKYIDDAAQHLPKQYTLVFGSPADTVVAHLATERMVQLLSSLGATHVETLYNYSNAGHAWVTDSTSGSNPCDYVGSPYINDCGLAFGNVFLKKAFNFLGIMTSPLNAPAKNQTEPMPELILFNQQIFGADPTKNSMDTAGYAFIPPRCRATRNPDGSSANPTINTTLCKLHLHFHGCQQSRATMGPGYASRTGLNTRWAVENDIVILYPQATPNALKYNPMGCWDWFNYNNENYYTIWGEFATKRGVQIGVVTQIINAALSGT